MSQLDFTIIAGGEILGGEFHPDFAMPPYPDLGLSLDEEFRAKKVIVLFFWPSTICDYGSHREITGFINLDVKMCLTVSTYQSTKNLLTLLDTHEPLAVVDGKFRHKPVRGAGGEEYLILKGKLTTVDKALEIQGGSTS